MSTLPLLLIMLCCLRSVVHFITMHIRGQTLPIMLCRHGNIGFLKTSNRINVMLSRAKHGMYILGHADTLIASKRSQMWRQVMLQDVI